MYTFLWAELLIILTYTTMATLRILLQRPNSLKLGAAGASSDQTSFRCVHSVARCIFWVTREPNPKPASVLCCAWLGMHMIKTRSIREKKHPQGGRAYITQDCQSKQKINHPQSASSNQHFSLPDLQEKPKKWPHTPEYVFAQGLLSPLCTLALLLDGSCATLAFLYVWIFSSSLNKTPRT